MQLIRHLPELSDTGTAVAIGNFDGLHLGHQAVIAACVNAAHGKGLIPSVLTFEPHPRRFFGRMEPDFRLERLSTKLQRLAAASIGRVYMPRFDARFAALSAEAFMETILARALGAQVVVTGENFAFGHARSGNVARLREWGAANGIAIVTVPPVMVRGHICASSTIRDALAVGDMDLAAALLGRPYTLAGTVVHGDGRGAAFGFATANLALPALLRHPVRGVYAVRAWMRGVRYDGVANLGIKPTVRDNAQAALEVHLFDDMDALYGRRLEVEFVTKLRDERKFDSVDALITQIAHDCVAAKAALALTPKGT